MQITDSLAALVAGRDLNRTQTRAVFDTIMAGQATPAQIAAVLIGLKAKGETVEEIAGAAEAMRAVSTKVDVDVANLVDTCGTGGSGAAKRFNISTAAAFVAAAAGAHVAKHGNRGASSASGSADVLEASGANVELEPDQVGQCIREVGVGFLFAVRHHAAMRHAGPVRRELGFGTIFNLLGPLTNPAGAKRQVLGVFAPAWQRPLAEVAQALGSERVLVVHSDGLDELSIQGPSVVVELNEGSIDSYEVSPADFGLREKTMENLRAQTPEQSLGLIVSALNESNEAASDVVALNAGAAIYASGVTTTLANGVVLAQKAITSGQASDKLKEFVDLTRTMDEE